MTPAARRRALVQQLPDVQDAAASTATAHARAMHTPTSDLALVLRLTEGHGLRISEALGIDAVSLSTPGVIVVQPSKGSRERHLMDADLYYDLLAALERSPTRYAIPYTRRDIYETLRARGYGYTPEGASTARITHAGRARFIQSLIADGKTHEQAAQIVGLRNVEVIQKYLT